MVTVETCYVYNVKTITFNTKTIPNTKDKWIGDYNHGLEKNNIKHFMEQFKL